jgi:hypothetical protein
VVPSDSWRLQFGIERYLGGELLDEYDLYGCVCVCDSEEVSCSQLPTYSASTLHLLSLYSTITSSCAGGLKHFVAFC